MTPEALSAAVVRFNFDPIYYSHPSWWVRGGLAKTVFRQLVDNPVAASILSKKMLADYRIDDQFDFDFTHPFKRIAFLTYEQQKQIIFRLGLVIYRAHIARAVHATEQGRLLNLIDYSDYLLALRMKLDHKLVSGVHLPELPLSDRQQFRVAVYLAGFSLLTNILAVESAGYKKRFYFTWPKPAAVKRLSARFSTGRQPARRSESEKTMVERLAALPDYVLYCRQLNHPELLDLGKRLLGTLLSIQGVVSPFHSGASLPLHGVSRGGKQENDI